MHAIRSSRYLTSRELYNEVGTNVTSGELLIESNIPDTKTALHAGSCCHALLYGWKSQCENLQILNQRSAGDVNNGAPN